MFVTSTLTGLCALALATPALLLAGHRWRRSSPVVSAVSILGWTVLAGETSARLFRLPSSQVLLAEVFLATVAMALVVTRPTWNPIGHVFFAALVFSSGSYLALASRATFADDLSLVATAASVLLLVLEIFAITIACTFAFESIDVACRVRWRRPPPRFDEDHVPFVSLHVPAYNEPPNMLIDTIRSLEAIKYPSFEIVVIDNNTRDDEVWRPVEAYCADRARVRFVHVDPWPGYKSGALNLVLTQHTAPGAEIIGIVDADYLVRADYLAALTGYFADPALAFVQTPQDYREYEGDTYLTACYDAYRYFFETAMPSRNDRNSIIFGGTMGLIRRSVLEDLGGWDEWCITEDAESSLRMLRAGHLGLYVNQTYGQGIMPLTFTALKKQRFRWCFGGVQILRKHWRSLMPWDRDPTNRMSVAQRLDYLFGGLQWFGDLTGLAFTLLLASSAVLLLTTGEVALRALTGALVLLPAALISSGLLRALWALRALSGISTRRAVLAFATWLSLSWTTALACVRGLVRRDGVFLRTPKWRSGGRLIEALRETRVETALSAGLGALAVAVVLAEGRTALAALAGWQALVFACSPYMAWLNQRTELSARLARRARSEDRRDRVSAAAPGILRSGAFGLSAVALLALLLVGGAQRSPQQSEVFEKPTKEADDRGPLGNIGVRPPADEGPPVATPRAIVTPPPQPVDVEEGGPRPLQASRTGPSAPADGGDAPSTPADVAPSTTRSSAPTSTTPPTSTVSPATTRPTAPTSTTPPTTTVGPATTRPTAPTSTTPPTTTVSPATTRPTAPTSTTPPTADAPPSTGRPTSTTRPTAPAPTGSDPPTSRGRP